MAHDLLTEGYHPKKECCSQGTQTDGSHINTEIFKKLELMQNKLSVEVDCNSLIEQVDTLEAQI